RRRRRAAARPRAVADAHTAAAGVHRARERRGRVTERERLPGARPLPARGTRFSVWAPFARRVELRLVLPDEVLPLEELSDGWYAVDAPPVEPGRRYGYQLDGSDPLPDPASAAQPDGVHGLSAVVDPAFPWSDHSWPGVPLDEVVLYELHVGTFAPEGTFDAVCPRLDALAKLGITMIELMPVAQFPGNRN